MNKNERWKPAAAQIVSGEGSDNDHQLELIAIKDRKIAKLEAELHSMTAELREIIEIYAGMEGGFKSETAPEAYLLRIIAQMYEQAREATSAVEKGDGIDKIAKLEAECGRLRDALEQIASLEKRYPSSVPIVNVSKIAQQALEDEDG